MAGLTYFIFPVIGSMVGIVMFALIKVGIEIWRDINSKHGFKKKTVTQYFPFRATGLDISDKSFLNKEFIEVSADDLKQKSDLVM